MIAIQYLPLSVRVRAWSQTLFSSEEIRSLSSQDLQSIMHKVSLKDPSISKTDTIGFLQSLRSSMFGYIVTGLRISSAEGRHFMRELARESEIENLKLIVKMLCSGKFHGEFQAVHDTSYISEKKMLEVHTFSELISLLSGTLYEPLLESLHQVEQEQNSSYWESAIDNLYMQRLFMSSKRLDRQSAKAVKTLFITPILLEQLILVYRYRFHYHMNPEDILPYINNVPYILSLETWKKFLYAPTSSEFMTYLKEHGFCDDSVLDDASEIRLHFRRKLEKLCYSSMHKQLTGISSFIAFIQLKKIQVQKITTIVTSKSLHAYKGDISKYL